MKKIIIPIVLLFILVSFVYADISHYYKIELAYDRGEITYNSISIEPTQKEIDNPGANYIAEIIGEKEPKIITKFEL